jgi:hypothetical protein
VKSLMLWKLLAYECASRCCTTAQRDIDTVTSRIKTEGLSFLTISLPIFCQGFEKSLEDCRIDSTAFPGFGLCRGTPKFLSGFLRQVFCERTGVLLDTPSIEAIRCIRQLTLLFKRFGSDCSPRRTEEAFKGYIKLEMEMRDFRPRASKEVLRLKSLLLGQVFSDVDLLIYNGDIIPQHGNGATSDRLKGNQKWSQLSWPERLEWTFPYLEHVLPNHRYFDHLGEVDFLRPEAELPVKVICVPKTMKTPRIIAMEPTAMQYMQQAIMLSLREAIESSFLNDFIGTASQDPNKYLAQLGSSSTSLATLDLSEASDRVSWSLVEDLLRRHPHLHEAVSSTRSRRATLPSESLIDLAKFASMGSALTFPVESIVFFLLVLHGIEKSTGHQLTLEDVKSLKGRVRIYGDDIIIPSIHVRSVIDVLESYGLKVNRHKSFWNGKFRESCGGDYYDGKWVTPVYCRRNLPRSRKDVQDLLSAVSFRNQLYLAGFFSTVSWLDRQILRVLKVFPFVPADSPVLGRLT